MEYVFGNTLVCETKEAARAICDRFRLQTVSLEGDKFDPSGILVGGSRARTSLYVRNRHVHPCPPMDIPTYGHTHLWTCTPMGMPTYGHAHL